MIPSGNGAPERLPSGRHQLDITEVQEHQRARLIEAVAELSAERGFANVVISDIVTRAAVSKTTFYRFYVTKEACLFDAHKHYSASLLAAIDSHAEGCSSTEEAIRAAIRAALQFAAARPNAAALLTTGILSTGSAGEARYRTATRAIAQRLSLRGGGEPPAEALAAVLFAAPVIAFSQDPDDPASVLALESEFTEIALAYAERS